MIDPVTAFAAANAAFKGIKMEGLPIIDISAIVEAPARLIIN